MVKKNLSPQKFFINFSSNHWYTWYPPKIMSSPKIGQKKFKSQKIYLLKFKLPIQIHYHILICFVYFFSVKSCHLCLEVTTKSCGWQMKKLKSTMLPTEIEIALKYLCSFSVIYLKTNRFRFRYKYVGRYSGEDFKFIVTVDIIFFFLSFLF